MGKKPLVWGLVIGVLVIGSLLLLIGYSNTKRELDTVKAQVQDQEMNKKILEFAQLFIERVLQSENEVDFETRLLLENSVRNINDEEILQRWQNFVDSRTEAEAQVNVKNLLETLVQKSQAE